MIYAMKNIKTFLLNHIYSVVSFVILLTLACVVEYLTGQLSWYVGLEAFAVVYVVHNIKLCIFYPAKFDWLMSKGAFIWRIALFVLSFPLVVSFAIHVANPMIDKYITPTEVVYSADMLDDGVDAKQLRADINDTDSSPSLLWTLYYHFVDPGNQHVTPTLRGRIIAGVCAGLGVLLLNGLLISVLIGAFDVRRDRWRSGTLRYDRFFSRNPHYVIIGGSDISQFIVNNIFEEAERHSTKLPYILIQTDHNVEELRNHLSSALDQKRQQHVVIYYGHRTTKEDVADLVLQSAVKVFLLGESGVDEANESMHDSYSMRCIEHMNDYIQRFRKAHNMPKVEPLEVDVLFEHQTTFSIYQLSDMQNGLYECINFKPMNYYEIWAQKVLVCERLGDELMAEYLPLEGEGIAPDSDDYVHLIIVGMSRMGVALGVEASHLAHYPNFETKHKRTRITFIDPDMEREYNFFRGRFRGFFELARYRYADASMCGYDAEEQGVYYNESYGKWIEPWTRSDGQGRSLYGHLGDDFIDVEWEFIKGSVEMPAIQQYMIDAVAQPNTKLTIAICQPEPNSAAATALYLPREVYNSSSVLQVLVYQRYDDSLFCNLSKMKYKTPFNGRIKPFGMISEMADIWSFDVHQKLAQKIGEHYNKESVYTGRYEKEWLSKCGLAAYESLFDYVIHSGDDSPEWVKQNREKIVEANNIYNRFVGCINPAALQPTIERLLKQCREQEGKLNKNITMKAWSNLYNANILWTKLRCVGYKPGTRLSVEQVWHLSAVEHARWNMEQLLLSQMPINRDELAVWISAGKDRRSIKDLYKAERKHPNICSLAMIHSLDKIFFYDVALTIYLEELYRMQHSSHNA